MPVNRHQQRQQPQQPVNGGVTSVHTTTEETVAFPRILRLRGESESQAADTVPNEESSASRRVRWDETVVNNEGMGKKSSKVCCIYHKPRALDESSSESSSSDDSDSDEDMRAAQRPSRRQRRGPCEDDDDASCPGHNHDDRKLARKKKPSPNAYERVPKNNRKGAIQPKVA